ncbi:MAG: glycosyltransferase family 2 protein, partial [Salinispira sp.]
MKTIVPFFVALIATHNRPALLAKRALSSIAAQQRRPDLIVVADDSDPCFRTHNKKTVETFAVQTNVESLYIDNGRCQGASGAWNSGALEVLGMDSLPSAEDIYLAILDDDDEWFPWHLANAETVVQTDVKKRADVLMAAFARRE